MKKDIRQTPIWKRFEHCGLAYEQLHGNTNKLYDKYKMFFDEMTTWTVKFQALNNTIVTYSVESGINPIENEIRNETILAIGDLAAKSLPIAQQMVKGDVGLFKEILGQAEMYKDTAQFLNDNIQRSKECEAKVQQIETALSIALQHYTTLENHLKTVTGILEQQKQLYFKVVN